VKKTHIKKEWYRSGLKCYIYDSDHETWIITLKKLMNHNSKQIRYWMIKLKKKTNLKKRTKEKKIMVKSDIK
jgi:hypothetical protein